MQDDLIFMSLRKSGNQIISRIAYAEDQAWLQKTTWIRYVASLILMIFRDLEEKSINQKLIYKYKNKMGN